MAIETRRSAFAPHHPPDPALIEDCVHVGFCVPSCPSYVVLAEEMDNPRGRIYLMKAAHQGRVGLNATVVPHFDQCLGCMACVTACPAGVQYGKLIEDTRGQIERRWTRSRSEWLARRAIFAVFT